MLELLNNIVMLFQASCAEEQVQVLFLLHTPMAAEQSQLPSQLPSQLLSQFTLVCPCCSKTFWPLTSNWPRTFRPLCSYVLLYSRTFWYIRVRYHLFMYTFFYTCAYVLTSLCILFDLFVNTFWLLCGGFGLSAYTRFTYLRVRFDLYEPFLVRLCIRFDISAYVRYSTAMF